MAIIGVASSVSDYDYATGATAVTSGSFIDTTAVSEGVQNNVGGFAHNLYNTYGVCMLTLTASASEGNIAYQQTRGENNSSVGTIISVTLRVFSDATPLFMIMHTSTGSGNTWASGTFTFYYWNGSSWLALSGSSAFGTISDASRHTWNVQIKMHGSAGFVRIYVDDLLLFNSGLINTLLITSGPTTFNKISFGPGPSVRSVVVSEVVVTDSASEGFNYRLFENAPSAAGNYTAWNNGKTEIDETGYDDADFIYINSANQLETYTLGDLTSGWANYGVAAFAVTARAIRSVSGPQNMQAVVRTSGSDFVSSNLANLDTFFRGGLQAIWAVNPNTSAAWTQAEINALEAGVKSIT